MSAADLPVAKLRCPKCHSRLDVIETPSGARTISVTFLGASVEQNARSLETFQGPDAGVLISCPACGTAFDPAEPPSSIPPLRRS
jgi:hypothetical protein